MEIQSSSEKMMLLALNSQLLNFTSCQICIAHLRICITEVGRDLWRSYGSTPLVKQGHVKPAAQGQGMEQRRERIHFHHDFEGRSISCLLFWFLQRAVIALYK